MAHSILIASSGRSTETIEKNSVRPPRIARAAADGGPGRSYPYLCGAATAAAYAGRRFRAGAGEYCGDHDLARYLARVNVMKRVFFRLAKDY